MPNLIDNPEDEIWCDKDGIAGEGKIDPGMNDRPAKEYDAMEQRAQEILASCFGDALVLARTVAILEVQIATLRLELHNTEMALKYAQDENHRVRMALMPLLESEDPAEAIEELRADTRVIAEEAITFLKELPFHGSTPELRQQVIDDLRKIVGRDDTEK